MIPNDIPEQYKRESGERPWKPTFVIATEGEKTEPNYFAYLDRFYQEINIVLLPANDGHSQPRQVLDKILCKKQEFEKEDMKAYQYWIVFDHDARPRTDLESVMQDAIDNQISVADSNPCFETWLIQHFSSLTEIVELSHVTPVKSCAQLINKQLKRQEFDPEYKKRSLDGDLYMPRVNCAIQNAEYDENVTSDLDEFCYTGSRVKNLVKQLLSLD